MEIGRLSKSLVEGFKMIGLLATIVVGIVLSLALGLTVIGAVFNVVTSGDVPTTTVIGQLINSTQGNFASVVGKLLSGLTFGGGLIPLVLVVLILGGGIVAGVSTYRSMGKGGKGNMGY